MFRAWWLVEPRAPALAVRHAQDERYAIKCSTDYVKAMVSLRQASVNNFFTIISLFSYVLPRYRLVDKGDVTLNAKRSAGILFPG
jgi:hypothetical protein